MALPIAPEGRTPVLVGAGVTMGLLFFGGRVIRRLGMAALGVTAGLAWFFRDPERTVVPIENGILAPADGRVIRIDTVDLPEFFDGPVRRVSIFMSVFDCHINRAPADGIVAWKAEADGGYEAAWGERAAEENRRTTLGIDGRPRVAMRQIAGLVARQIVTRPVVGQKLTQGERVGIIKFGSRVDVFFSLDLKLMIEVGERTWAGITALAELPR
jgi:phosphatidylserine decarboxylase